MKTETVENVVNQVWMIAHGVPSDLVFSNKVVLNGSLPRDEKQLIVDKLNEWINAMSVREEK